MGGGGIATYNGSLNLKGGEITNNIGKDVGGIHVGVSSKTYMSGNVRIYDNSSTLPNSTKKIYDIYVDSKILLNNKFTGVANFIKRGANNNDTSNVGDIWVSGDNYTITQEDASHIDILEENKILNLEENNLVVRNAAKVTFNSNIGENSEEKTQKVVKNNEGEVNATRKSSTSTETVNAPVVKMVGENSGVTIKENATVNGTSSPLNGTTDKDDVDIIVDTASGASASKIHNENNSSGGGGYYPSNPTYTHEEIIGSDRYDTAAKIADKLGSYDNVVLVNVESSMSDGLSASGLAGKENGAILLTKKDSIPKVTMDRIKKVKKFT